MLVRVIMKTMRPLIIRMYPLAITMCYSVGTVSSEGERNRFCAYYRYGRLDLWSIAAFHQHRCHYNIIILT